MKKIKNLFMAILMFGLLLVPSLNAEAGKASVGSIKTILNNQEEVFEHPGSDSNTYTIGEVKYSVSELFLNITALGSAEDKTASITVKKEAETVFEGDKGTIKLEVGENIFTVEVKDTDDDSNTTLSIYDVVITRKDKVEPRLTGINVKINDENGVIQTLDPVFSSDKFVYTVKVANEVEKVFIQPEFTSNVGLSVHGNEGVQELYSIGEDNPNVFYITVNNEEGDYQEYQINIIREDSQLIKDLKQELGDDYYIQEFTEGDKNYVAFLEIKTLSDGTEIVKGYRVEKKENSTKDSILSEFKEVVKKPAEEMMVNLGENYILSEEALTEIRNNGGVVYISGYDAAWKFDGSKITDSFKELKLKVLTGDEVNEELRNKVLSLIENKDQGLVIDFAHSGKLPEETKVSLYVGDKFNDGDVLTLYYYNTTSGKLNVTAKNIKVVDGEVEFNLEHCSTYVLTLASNNAQTGVMNVVFYVVLALISLVGIVFLTKKKAN